MSWAWFAVAVVLIVVCVVWAVGWIGEDLDAANHDALLDDLWGIDYDEEADVADFERLLGARGLGGAS